MSGMTLKRDCKETMEAKQSTVEHARLSALQATGENPACYPLKILFIRQPCGSFK